MPRAGHRYLLVLYAYILTRWGRLLLLHGLILLALTAVIYFVPDQFPGLRALPLSQTSLMILTGAGIFAVLSAIFLFSIRKFAYVQPRENHLLLVTPFLRLKISYRRIRQAPSVEVAKLYPFKRFRGRKRAIVKHLAKYTAVVLDLNALPLSRFALRLFLSSLFFPDKSPRLAIIVPDWMRFSAELESLRGAWHDAQRSP